MLIVEKSSHSLDLCKSEELKYQVSQLKYHLESVRLSLKEAVHHMKKTRQHASEIKECNKFFKH